MRTSVAPALLAAAAAATTLTACDSPESFLGGSLVTIGIVGLLALALIIYAVLDLIKSPLDLTMKLVWGVVIWVVPFLGALAYLFIGRK